MSGWVGGLSQVGASETLASLNDLVISVGLQGLMPRGVHAV